MISPDATLVIGYGNELRSDDGLGPRIARAVATWDLPHVRAVAVHQLTPELADQLAQASRVFFIDATLDCSLPPVSVVRVQAPSLKTLNPHASHPGHLLCLAQQVYGHVPEAWMIRVRAVTTVFGQELSPDAQRAMDEALEWLKHQLSPETD
jgi:hydrogenase maturation protease